MKTEREKMLAGELYNAGDAKLCAARARCWAPPGRISIWNPISNATTAAISM